MHILRLLFTGLVESILPAIAAAETPKNGGTLTFAVTAEAPSTDCHAITTYAAVHVLAPHYSLLLKVDPDNYPKLKPDLAESWSVSPDGLTYTFKIRPNVVFHDGSPLTSKDVQASFDRIRNPPAGVVSIRKELFADIMSIATPDPATVVMKIKEPDASFLGTLALPYNCVYSAAKLAEDANFPVAELARVRTITSFLNSGEFSDTSVPTPGGLAATPKQLYNNIQETHFPDPRTA